MYSSVVMPSTFAPAQRPIYIYPIAPMSKKAQPTSRTLIRDAIRHLLTTRTPGRVLVHTVSYDLNDYLFSELSRTRECYTYRKREDKESAIERYREGESAVLFAPSLERGVDFKDDLCRHIIIPKLPFPNLGDKQVSARLYSRGGSLWYSVKTVRSLVQMTGRGMRSETDSCTSYILDEQFISLIWNKSRHLLPSWWREALVWETLDLPPRPLQQSLVKTPGGQRADERAKRVRPARWGENLSSCSSSVVREKETRNAWEVCRHIRAISGTP